MIDKVARSPRVSGRKKTTEVGADSCELCMCFAYSFCLS